MAASASSGLGLASARATLGRPGAEPQPARSGPGNSASAAAFLAQEEEYRRLNAELEAKTADLVRQAEEVMRDQQEALTRPVSAQLDRWEEEAKSRRSSCMAWPSVGSSLWAAGLDLAVFGPRFPLGHLPRGDLPSPELLPLPVGSHKPPQKKNHPAPVTTARSGPPPGKAGRRTLPSAKRRPHNAPSASDVAVPDFSLAKTIGKIEGQLEEGNTPDLEDDLLPGAASELGAEAQIRFLKAKLRVMQEELDALAQECGKKEDENRSLSGRLREVEEERGRLQRTAALQQSQIEKHKSLCEDGKRRSEGLQQKLSGVEKELETLKRAQKQASASQSTMEVRLNRALEESEKYKMELNRLKQSNKDVVNQEHKKLEELKIENKRLEKQKEELMAGFKKQLKLIDILKRQKMHIESAKMLSFTEEEFMKALEWGNA